MDSKSEQYLHRQTENHRLIITEIRELIFTHFPSIQETGMAEGLWYEGIFYLATIGDHVNLGVGVKGLNEDELKHFEGKGKNLRHLKFYSPEDIHPNQLLALMQLVYDKNKSA